MNRVDLPILKINEIKTVRYIPSNDRHIIINRIPDTKRNTTRDEDIYIETQNNEFIKSVIKLIQNPTVNETQQLFMFKEYKKMYCKLLRKKNIPPELINNNMDKLIIKIMKQIYLTTQPN